MITVNKCCFCSNECVFNLKFNNMDFCTSFCIDNYIKRDGGIELNCSKCNKLFLKKSLGSHIIDVNNNVYAFCSAKCQFKQKS
jgi:hypothetical protein